MTMVPALAWLLWGSSMGPATTDEVSGEFSLGWRNVSVAGAQEKYAEDINLDSGVRLFDARLTYRPEDENSNWLDLMEIELHNLGGEPFESMRMELRKYGAYRFKAQRRRSDYFYDDIIVLPDNASIEGSTGGDFHRFDFERIRDEVSLDVTLNERAEVGLGYERFEKRGDSTTTLDVQRDEFELDKPIDETMQLLRLGLRYEWDKFTLSVEERMRDYENRAELLQPNFSVGGNSSDLSTLEFFFLEQPYDFQTNEHRVRLTARPSSRFEVNLNATTSNLDLDTHAKERSQGFDFTGEPFATDVEGSGEIDRKVEFYDINVALAATNRVKLTGGFNRQLLNQSGQFQFGPAEGGESTWDIQTSGFEVGVFVTASPTLSFSAGWTANRRDVDLITLPSSAAALNQSEETDSDGFIGMLDYRPNKHFSVSASIDDTNIDDPFTLVSPTQSTRYRVKAKYRFDHGLSLVASHSKTERDNKTSAWNSDITQSDLRITYATGGLLLSAGGSAVDLSRDFDRLVTGGSRQDLFSVVYAADTSYLDAAMRWAIHDRLTLGANYRAYDNDGSFKVKRDDILAFVELKLASPRYKVGLSYRNVDYAEGGIEDYDADLVEASFKVVF